MASRLDKPRAIRKLDPEPAKHALQRGSVLYREASGQDGSRIAHQTYAIRETAAGQDITDLPVKSNRLRSLAEAHGGRTHLSRRKDTKHRF